MRTAAPLRRFIICRLASCLAWSSRCRRGLLLRIYGKKPAQHAAAAAARAYTCVWNRWIDVDEEVKAVMITMLLMTMLLLLLMMMMLQVRRLNVWLPNPLSPAPVARVEQGQQKRKCKIETRKQGKGVQHNAMCPFMNQNTRLIIKVCLLLAVL